MKLNSFELYSKLKQSVNLNGLNTFVMFFTLLLYIFNGINDLSQSVLGIDGYFTHSLNDF